MPKSKHKQVRFSSRESAAEPPSEVELRRWKKIGRGRGAIERSLGRRLVALDPEVAKDFATSEEVNQALRLVQQLREVGRRKRKKTA